MRRKIIPFVWDENTEIDSQEKSKIIIQNIEIRNNFPKYF